MSQLFDPFALGGDQRDDAALLTLFREWRAGMRDIEGPRPAGETEDQYDAANHAVWDIARQIYDTPAAGPAGLAIKAFMLAFEVCIDDVDRPSLDEPASLGKFDVAQNHYGAGDRLYVRNHAIKGLAGDIARFVPELDPLVAGIVQSPVKRPPDRTEDRAAGPPLPAM
jgi:hypothetical protein